MLIEGARYLAQFLVPSLLNGPGFLLQRPLYRIQEWDCALHALRDDHGIVNETVNVNKRVIVHECPLLDREKAIADVYVARESFLNDDLCFCLYHYAYLCLFHDAFFYRNCDDENVTLKKGYSLDVVNVKRISS